MDDFEFDIDSCDNLLAEFGIIEAKATELARDECDCEGVIKKMQIIGEFYMCNSCSIMKNAYIEPPGSIAKGPNTYQIGSRMYTCYGTTTRDRNDKIADLINYFKNLIISNNQYIDPELLRDTCSVMFDITSRNIKKKDNRISLFAVLLYYTSIKQGRIMTFNEIKLMIKSKEFKFSKGTKIMSNALLHGIIEPDVVAAGVKIYDQLIAKYLSIYDPEFYLNDNNPTKRNINNDSNRRFCLTMIEIVLHKNIAFNSVIQSKCIAIVYYLVRNRYEYDDEIKQRHYFSSIAGVGENTYIRVYNTLISRDAQRMFRESGKFY